LKENRGMKKVLIGILTAAALGAVSLAQDTAAPTGSSPQQTQAQTQTQSNVTQSPTQQSAPVAQSPGAQSQSAQSQSAQSSTAPRVAAGSVIPVELTKTVDAKKAKTGDEVDAKVTQDLKSGSGEVLLPKDTKLIGHVTEAQSRSKEQKESQVAIAFDHAVTHAGDVQMPMSIQAIIAPTTLNSNNNAGGENASSAPSPTPSGGGMSPGTNGRGMGTQPQAPPSATTTTGGDYPSNDSSGSSAHAPITAKTQGVIGIRDMTLAPATDSTQGTIVTSDKNNVKLESGTLLLLRVNQ
jgi:hypothetical protein